LLTPVPEAPASPPAPESLLLDEPQAGARAVRRRVGRTAEEKSRRRGRIPLWYHDLAPSQ
jgi:hypothetical protein